jgi:hypothetical protein
MTPEEIKEVIRGVVVGVGIVCCVIILFSYFIYGGMVVSIGKDTGKINTRRGRILTFFFWPFILIGTWFKHTLWGK